MRAVGLACNAILAYVCSCMGGWNSSGNSIARQYIVKYNAVLRKLVAEYNGPR